LNIPRGDDGQSPSSSQIEISTELSFISRDGSQLLYPSLIDKREFVPFFNVPDFEERRRELFNQAVDEIGECLKELCEKEIRYRILREDSSESKIGTFRISEPSVEVQSGVRKIGSYSTFTGHVYTKKELKREMNVKELPEDRYRDIDIRFRISSDLPRGAVTQRVRSIVSKYLSLRLTWNNIYYQNEKDGTISPEPKEGYTLVKKLVRVGLA
jgi:hypothetical protein